MEREYIVTLHRNVDFEKFNEEMVDEYGDDIIPNRPVLMTNSRPLNKRNTHFMLTEEEVEKLKEDPRVMDVDVPPDQNDKVEIGNKIIQVGNFNKPSSGRYDPNKVNWGLVRCSHPHNPYRRGVVHENYEYDLDGTGVDIVIQDSGIQADHPEFQDENGVSRVQQIDWYEESGLKGSMPKDHYTDYSGHGTHVAGTAAGKTYGWAKNARIYSVKVNGLQGRKDPNRGIPVADAFDVIKGWHENKPVDPETGVKRPTIVNMSWGYSGNWNDFRSLTYRNRTFRGGRTRIRGGFKRYGLVGLWDGSKYITNTRISSVDTDIQELIDAGIHVCIAAGNNWHKIDVPGGPDYNNKIQSNNGVIFYHRGSSPYDDEALIVGNVDSAPSRQGKERKLKSSECGPGVNIWAPGTLITSCTSNVNNYNIDGNYPIDGRYKIVSISGTSMASPQVCGMGAIVLQEHPDLTPTQLRNWFFENSKSVLHTTNRDNDYNNPESLMGSPNRMIYNPADSEFIDKVKGS